MIQDVILFQQIKIEFSFLFPQRLILMFHILPHYIP